VLGEDRVHGLGGDGLLRARMQGRRQRFIEARVDVVPLFGDLPLGQVERGVHDALLHGALKWIHLSIETVRNLLIGRGAREGAALIPRNPQYSSMGGHAQNRFLSPYALLSRPTEGQNLFARTQGNGYAACSRE